MSGTEAAAAPRPALTREQALLMIAREKTYGVLDDWFIVCDGRTLVATKRAPGAALFDWEVTPPPESWQHFLGSESVGPYVRALLERQRKGPELLLAAVLQGLDVAPCDACSLGRVREYVNWACPQCEHKHACSAAVSCDPCNGYAYVARAAWESIAYAGEVHGVYLDRRLLALTLATAPAQVLHVEAAPEELYLWQPAWRAVVMGMRR